MRFSKFCKIYECCDKKNNFYYLLRHSLLNYMHLLSEKEFDSLLNELKKEIKTEYFEDLFKEHIIVQNNYSENKFLSYVIKDKKGNKPYFTIFYLIFDSKCNLNCKYCYVEGSVESSFISQKMESKTLETIFSFLEDLISKGKKEGFIGKNLVFIFYGSESLMHPDLLKESINQINLLSKEQDIPIEKEIITNGTLINSQLSKFFKENDVSISISLDGEKKINDKMRIYHNNTGSFEDIVKGINCLKDQRVPFSISCTIGPHNIDFLKENIIFFKTLGARGIGFNPLLDAKFNKIIFPSLYDTNKKLFEAFLQSENQNFLESRIGKKLKSFNNPGSVHIKDCGAYGNQLVFFPNGDIGICQASLGFRKNILGNIFSSTVEEVKNSDILKKWTNRTPLNYKKCLNCPAIGICGGGCAFSSEILYENIEKRNKKFCMHTLMTLDWFIENSLKRQLGSDSIYFKDISFMFL